MNTQDPLTALNPLREPQLIGWWPLAPGWWLLLVLLLLAAGFSVWLLYTRYRRNSYRRLGLGKLDALKLQHERSPNVSITVSAINALLKSVALRAYPRRDIASLSGEAWLAFLQQSAPEGPAFEPGTLESQYRKQPGDIDIDALALATRHWISRHKVTP